MGYPIPRKIVLPFGYTVRVVQVPYQELLLRGTEDGALWDVEAQVLYLDQDQPVKVKRYWLMSQLHHVVLDANHAMLDDGFMTPI